RLRRAPHDVRRMGARPAPAARRPDPEPRTARLVLVLVLHLAFRPQGVRGRARHGAACAERRVLLDTRDPRDGLRSTGTSRTGPRRDPPPARGLSGIRGARRAGTGALGERRAHGAGARDAAPGGTPGAGVRPGIVVTARGRAPSPACSGGSSRSPTVR